MEGKLIEPNGIKKTKNELKVHRRYHYRTKFKLTVEEYETKLAQQNYVCAICKNRKLFGRTVSVKKLSIDHLSSYG